MLNSTNNKYVMLNYTNNKYAMLNSTNKLLVINYKMEQHLSLFFSVRFITTV